MDLRLLQSLVLSPGSNGVTNAPRTDIDFQALFDAAPGGYLVLDADFNMVAANEARLKATMTTRKAAASRFAIGGR